MNFLKTLIPKHILIVLFLAVIFILLRSIAYHSNYHIYMLWNIFLALLPLIISSLMLWGANKNKLNKPLALISFIVWLLILPNAPYLVTDLQHLSENKSAPVIFDTLLFFSSAWLGLLIGMHSISQIEKLLQVKFKKSTASIFIGLTILIASFGVYLGRLLRFNSWDVLNSSSTLFSNVWKIFIHPYSNSEAYVFTGLFFVFFYLAYSAYKQRTI